MRRRGIGGDALLLLIAIILFAGLSFQISSHAPSDHGDDSTPRRTTNSSRPGGWRAFFLLLQGSGLPVERWTHRPSAWPADARVIVCGSDYAGAHDDAPGWSEGETESALKWVSAGGNLILLSDRQNAVTEALGITPAAAASKSTLTPAQPADILVGVRSVSSPDGRFWEKKPGRAVSLLVDRSQTAHGVPVAIVLAHGKGRIYAVASAAIADNTHLGEQDNARFLTQMVAILSADPAGKPGRVLFDEYHQGYDDDETLWGIIGPAGHMIVYELVVLALVAGYSAGRRFGLPEPLPTPQRVSSEYVRSLADLYRRGRAGDAALEGIYRSFRRDLCRAIGMPQEAPVTEVALAAAASLAGGDKDLANRLRTWMDTCEAKISGGAGAVPDAELLQIALGLQSLRKELQLGGTDPARPA